MFAANMLRLIELRKGPAKCHFTIPFQLKMTPLHWAVQKGHKSIAKVLLQHGADPNAMSKFSKSPITLAVELEQNDLVQELLIQNLQRSDFEQQQAADTLVHELSVRMKVIFRREKWQCSERFSIFTAGTRSHNRRYRRAIECNRNGITGIESHIVACFRCLRYNEM